MSNDPIAESIFGLLRKRGAEGSICPSEVARRLWPVNWRPHMEEVREVAIGLAQEEIIIITKGDQVMTPDQIRGAIRLRMGPSFPKDEEE